MAFQMRNNDLFQPSQEVLFIDQQHQMLFNGGQGPTAASLDPSLGQAYGNPADGQLYRDPLAAAPDAQLPPPSLVDSSLSR